MGKKYDNIHKTMEENMETMNYGSGKSPKNRGI